MLLDQAGTSLSQSLHRYGDRASWRRIFGGGGGRRDVLEPWLSRAAEQGQAPILTSTRDLIADCLAFNSAVVQQRLEVTRIVHADFKAIDYAKARPVQASEIVAK